jgi:hypothetical protein
MEFIDKTKHRIKGETIVSDFLKEFKGNYQGNLYSQFKNPQKQQFIDLLLQEQNNRCCYCMKKLDVQKDSIQIEHLIPQSVTDRTKFDEYLNPDTVLNKDNVCLESEFLANQVTPPFPHTLACQNLVASCSGKHFPSEKASHCNSFRGNKDIKPIVLYATITKDVEYKPNGFVIWEKETEDIPTVEKLGLNDDLLRMIRRIWYYAISQHINILNFSQSDKNKIIYQLIADIDQEEEKILLNFEKDVYWNLLKKYDYFRLKFLAGKLNSLTQTESRDLIENFDSNLNKQTNFLQTY